MPALNPSMAPSASTALLTGARVKSGAASWTNTPEEEDEQGFYEVSRLKQQYLDYLGIKVQEYEEQKQARHYYHGAQWTPEEIKILRQRRQPIVTFNRVSRKVDSIVSLAQRLRQEPKAYPRTPQGDGGAEIATQGIRTVLDGNQWRNLDFMSCRQAAVDGVGGIELKLVDGDHDDPDVAMDIVFGDDFFYDPRSYKPDFSDARYMGIAKWLDVEAAVELFPDFEDTLRDLVDWGFDLTTHSDREFRWINTHEKRLRLVEHWYRHNNKWFWAFYIGDVLLDEGVSPFRDERNKPMCRFIMFSAAVDHDGDRYGFVRNLKGPQDEVNQRRSKALHISNVTRVTIGKGAVDDIETFRRESVRPDGVREINPGFFDQVKDEDKQADLKAQLDLMQDARQEIDSFANINPALMAQSDTPDDHSGVAINLLQKAGIAEIGSFLLAYRDWKIRVYRAIWNIITREWKSERWIRVTDDQGLTSFLQINGTGVDQYGLPIVINNIGQLDVDVILDEGPDEINMMHDSLMTLNALGPQFAQQFPEIVLELSPIQGSVKRQMLDKIKAAKAQPPPPDPKLQQEMQIAQMKGQQQAQAGQQQQAIAQVRGQAEVAKAQQDQQQSQVEAGIEQERARAEMVKLHMEAVYREREHGYKMAELAAQARHRNAQRSDQRKKAAA
jgi:hypothetical protein